MYILLIDNHDEVVSVDSLGDIVWFLHNSGAIRLPTKEETLHGLVEKYKGTCNSINSEDQEWLENNDLYDAFYQEIFECSICGWWCEVGDYNEEACEELGEDVCSTC